MWEDLAKGLESLLKVTRFRDLERWACYSRSRGWERSQTERERERGGGLDLKKLVLMGSFGFKGSSNAKLSWYLPCLPNPLSLLLIIISWGDGEAMNSSLRWIKMLILTRGGLPLVNPLQLCALITMQLSIAVDQLESVGFDGVITKGPTF